MGSEPNGLFIHFDGSRGCPHGVTESPRLQGILTLAPHPCALSPHSPGRSLTSDPRFWTGFRSSVELNTLLPAPSRLHPPAPSIICPYHLAMSAPKRSLQESVVVPSLPSHLTSTHSILKTGSRLTLSPGPSSGLNELTCSPYLHQHPPPPVPEDRRVGGGRRTSRNLLIKAGCPRLQRVTLNNIRVGLFAYLSDPY